MNSPTGENDSAHPDPLSSPDAPQHPHLQAVKEGDFRPASELRPSEETRDRQRGFWVLGLALLACCGMLLWLAQQNRGLEAEVGSLEIELAETSEALSAAGAAITRYEQRMDEVRGSVAELVSRLGALQGLVDQDPSAQSSGFR